MFEDGFVLSKCFKLQTGIYGSIVIGILGDDGCQSALQKL